MDMNSQLVQTNDFELRNFTDDANFDQFIDLIRGENEEQSSGFDCDLINGLLADNQFDNYDPPAQEGIFNFRPDAACSNSILLDQVFAPITLPTTMGGDMISEDIDDDEDSSATITTTPTTGKTKTDRSRTLISERKRRGKMKDKLYALRSLVPNITKMDKASIIGDAVLYVQELQMQAKRLKADTVGLETSLVRSERYQRSNKYPRKIQLVANNIINNPRKKIMQMNVFQVEERGFYVKLESNKGHGVAGSLYRTLESLTSFKIQSSNLTTVSDRFILTFNLKVKEREMNMNLPNLKLWITGALLNQGFELTSSCA